MSKKGHVPIRTCIGCRGKKRKEKMLRFIQSIDGVAFVNQKKGINGRGFYLCPNLNCIKMAQRKKKWFEALGSKDLLYPLVKGLELGRKGNDED